MSTENTKQGNAPLVRIKWDGRFVRVPRDLSDELRAARKAHRDTEKVQNTVLKAIGSIDGVLRATLPEMVADELYIAVWKVYKPIDKAYDDACGALTGVEDRVRKFVASSD